MSINYLLYFSICISIFFANGNKDEISQWRGPNRDGKFPAMNLLQQWPTNGPEVIWSFEGLVKVMEMLELEMTGFLYVE